MLSNYGNFHPVKKNGIPSSKAASSACEKGNKWLLALEMLRMAKDRKPAPDFPAFSQMKYAWYMDEFSRDIKRKKPSIEYKPCQFSHDKFSWGKLELSWDKCFWMYTKLNHFLNPYETGF